MIICPIYPRDQSRFYPLGILDLHGSLTSVTKVDSTISANVPMIATRQGEYQPDGISTVHPIILSYR